MVQTAGEWLARVLIRWKNTPRKRWAYELCRKLRLRTSYVFPVAGKGQGRMDGLSDRKLSEAQVPVRMGNSDV